LEVVDWILLARDRTVMELPVIKSGGVYWLGEKILVSREELWFMKLVFVRSLVGYWFQWIFSCLNRADLCRGDHPCFIRNDSIRVSAALPSTLPDGRHISWVRPRPLPSIYLRFLTL
jgi:hypothetical protein